MLARLKSEFAYARGLLSGVARTRIVGAAPTKTVGDYFEEWARRHGDRPALGERRRILQLPSARRSRKSLRALGAGQGPRQGRRRRLDDDEPSRISRDLARLRARRAATALINTNLTGPSLAHCFAPVKAKAAVVESRLMPAFATARPLLEADLAVYSHGAAATGESRIDIEVEALSDASLGPGERPALTTDDAALFIYTSGTTGLPKAARITHGRVLRMMLGFSAVAGARASDRMYICLPMYHTNGGLLAPGMALAAGGSCWIRERFSASAFWSDAIAQKCTMFIYIGEMCRFLVNTPPSAEDRAHEIRLCLGNGLRPDIFAAFQQRFGIPRVIEFYGATEGNAALFNLDSHPGSVGRLPFWAASRFPIKIVAFDVETNTQKRDARGHCIECAVDEVGELLAEIRDDPKMPAARFDGYADPAATKAKVLRDVFKPGDAWFRTGDLMRRDARGYYYFVDRIGDTFRWKGENVSTTEVAETIDSFAGVREVDRLRRRGPGPRRPGRHGGAGGRGCRDVRPRGPARPSRRASARLCPAVVPAFSHRSRNDEHVQAEEDATDRRRLRPRADCRAGVLRRSRRRRLSPRRRRLARRARRGDRSIVSRGAPFVETATSDDLARREAEWRDLASRAAEPNAFAESAFLLPALRLAGAGLTVLLVWRDASRRGLIGVMALRAPPLGQGLARVWRSEQAGLAAVMFDAELIVEALEAVVAWLRIRPGVAGLILPGVEPNGRSHAPFARWRSGRRCGSRKPTRAGARRWSRRRRRLRGRAGEEAPQGMGASGTSAR